MSASLRNLCDAAGTPSVRRIAEEAGFGRDAISLRVLVATNVGLDIDLRPTHRLSLRSFGAAESPSEPMSLRDVAASRGIDAPTFSVHELVTPQFGDGPATYRTEWENWLDDYDDGRARVKPTSKDEFVAAAVTAVRNGRRIRAVGSGHSHSRAAQPSDLFVDLSDDAPLFDRLSDLESTLDDLSTPRALFAALTTTQAQLRAILRYPNARSLLVEYGIYQRLTRIERQVRNVDSLQDAVEVFADLNRHRRALVTALRRVPDPPYGHTGLLDTHWLKTDPPGVADDERLVRIKSGTMLKELMQVHLADRDLGLSNMGSWDGQTVAGAINTGTHGTGIRLGGLPDMVRSVELVTVTAAENGDPLVQLRRIEPDDGITDRSAFEAAQPDHHTVLHQDDDLFHAVVLGYGCVGLAYSYTLAVEDSTYWISEDETVRRWPELRDDLGSTLTEVDDLGRAPVLSTRARHVNLLVNVARMQGADATLDAECLVRFRNRAPSEDAPAVNTIRWPPERRRTAIEDLIRSRTDGVDPRTDYNDSSILGVTDLAAAVGNRFDKNRKPFMPPRPGASGYDKSAYYVALRRMRDATDATEPPEPPTQALSTEVAVPAEDVADAIGVAIQTIRDDDSFYAVPLGIRFVAPSEQFLSAEYDRLTAMVEVPFPVTAAGGLDTETLRDDYAKPGLARIQRRLIESFDGRPHLGKYNDLDFEDMRRLFPEFGSWLAVYGPLNEFGTFNNGFTDQLGISN